MDYKNQDNIPKIAGIYIRVSTEDQARGAPRKISYVV